MPSKQASPFGQIPHVLVGGILWYFYFLKTKASITTVSSTTFYQKGCASACAAGQLTSYFNGAAFRSQTSCCTGSNCNSGVLF